MLSVVFFQVSFIKVKVKFVQMVGHHAIKTYLKLYTLLTSALHMGAWLAGCSAITSHRKIISVLLSAGNDWDSEQT
jgi:hypothetical protein